MSDKLLEVTLALKDVTGELRGEVSGLRDTLSRMNEVCCTHEDAIRKNTNFRHYCKGAAALAALFCGYLTVQIEAIKDVLKSFVGWGG